MPGQAGGFADLPVVVWVLLLGLAVFLGRYGYLRWQWARSRPTGLIAERRLAQAARRLHEYAAGRGGRLPVRLAEAGDEPDDSLAYRPSPSLTLDERLILLHDARPTHKLLEFPMLREGRGVILCSGRLVVVSEDAFQRLVAADNALRERLGLEKIEAEFSEGNPAD